LLHSAIVVEKRGALKIWTILLSILAFSLSLIGTFLVRSGILTSVHAFAVDPERGVFILAILAIFVGGSLSLFALRAPSLKAGGLFATVSREGGLVLNNLLLSAACAAVFIGTLYPLALETLTGDKISVGAPYFNLTFGPIFIPLLLLCAARSDADLEARRCPARPAPPLVGCGTGPGLHAAGAGPHPARAVAGTPRHRRGLLADVRQCCRHHAAGGIRQQPLAIAWARFKGLPRSAFGTALAHGGLGMIVIGVIILSVWKEEHILTAKPGDEIPVAGYTVVFKGVEPLVGPNYDGSLGRFDIMRDGALVKQVVSEKRQFRPRGMPTTEVGLLQDVLGDVYVVLGDPAADGAFVVRASFNPMASFIWLGAFIMFLGGVLSLTDRRLRIGVPKRAAFPAAAAQPAE
jgi:cytochrome c-type biogenesis protein CcmF